MVLRPTHVVIDADDVDALRDFWIEALGYQRPEQNEFCLVHH